MRWFSIPFLLVMGCAGGSTELDETPIDSAVAIDSSKPEAAAETAAVDSSRVDGAAADASADTTVVGDTAVADTKTMPDTAMPDTAMPDTGACSAAKPCGGGLACCGGFCVDTSTSLDHCGKCGDKCSIINGSGKCVAGSCVVDKCSAGWGDCDMDGKSCEASTTLEIANCGGCGMKCTLADATSACVDGKCAVASCSPGYADCDKKPDNGCEVNLKTDPLNCGACGATPAETCNGLDDDCDGVADDGLGCKLGTPPAGCTTTCGTAGTRTCSSTCVLSGCTPPAETCNLVDDDCNGKCDDLAGCRTAVHRNYKPSTGEHFYTTSETEGPGAGFTLEFKDYFFLYSGSHTGTTLLYRCWVAGVSKHLYTTDPACEGQTVEGPMGYLATTAVCGAVPLYRLYLASNGDHFYTTSASERASAMSSGYVDEGITGYVWTGSSG